MLSKQDLTQQLFILIAFSLFFFFLFTSLDWWLHIHLCHQFPFLIGCYIGTSDESCVFQISSKFPCGIGCGDFKWRCFLTSPSACKY